MGKFKTRLRELRNATKLSQEATAQRVGISKISYQRYESGERDIPGDVLTRLSVLFDVSTDYIMMATDDPERYSPTESDLTRVSQREYELLKLFRKCDEFQKQSIIDCLQKYAGDGHSQFVGIAMYGNDGKPFTSSEINSIVIGKSKTILPTSDGIEIIETIPGDVPGSYTKVHRFFKKEE